MKKLYIILIILFITACVRGNSNDNENAEDNTTADVIGLVDSITISVDKFNEQIISQIANDFIVPVEIISYTFDKEEEHYNEIYSKIVAGIGPDIIIMPHHRLWTLIQNNLLADINQFINRNYFYENILSAYEINNILYNMPLSFAFNFIGINSNVPQDFIDRFSTLEYINIKDISNIYNDIISEYPEFTEYSIIRDLGYLDSIKFEFDIDFNARTANVTPLYDFITNITQIFENNRRVNMPFFSSITDEYIALLAEHYIFSSLTDPIDALFPFAQTSFVDYKPFANMNGELVESVYMQYISITHTAPPIVSLFLEQLFKNNFNNNIPIIKDNMRSTLEETWQRRNIRPFIGEQFANIQNILDKIEIYTKNPIASNNNRFLPNTAFEFIDNLPKLEDFIIEWLNEIPTIEEYIPETDFILPTENTRTLTIRTNNNFIPVANQARDMFNANWEERGYYLILNLEPNSTEERLRTELMSGLAPDLIFNERFSIYQLSDYLTDFYNLMDNKDDFFIEPLRANEFKGGLYELPMMFDFFYVGISENLPESVLNRFKQLSYIKASDLFNIYFDFIDNYDTFLNIGFYLTNPNDYNIMEYIDFSTNKVSLDMNFIESFLLYNRFTTGDYRIEEAYSKGMMFVDSLRERARENMYHFFIGYLNPADMFLGRNIPFTNIIPLANDYGSLIVNFGLGGMSDGNVSPRVLIPAAGDVELAWEFVQYLIKAFAEPIGEAATVRGYAAPWGSDSFSIPILRSLFESNINAVFDRLGNEDPMKQIYHFYGFNIGEELEIAKQNAKETLYKYANMPMVTGRFNFPEDLISNPLDDFLLGIITAQEAITRVENALTLWFME